MCLQECQYTMCSAISQFLNSVQRFVWVCLTLTALGNAEVLRVPSQYSTIQSALDAVSANDTILVDTGTYHETLAAPALQFWLIGNADADSSLSNLPTIDPSPLPDSDTLACLYLPFESRVFISNVRFRNGPEMHDSTSLYYRGGIVDGADTLTVNHCIFDSVRGGIFSRTSHEFVQHVDISNSMFNSCTQVCVYTSGRVRADDCYFSGPCSQSVHGNFGSTIRRCTFRDNGLGYLLLLGGDSLVVEDCVFGPDSVSNFPKISIGLFNGTRTCLIRNNIYHDIVLARCILEIAMHCPNDAPLPFIIEGNTFQNFSCGIGQGGRAITFTCLGNGPGYYGRLDSNIFQDGVSIDGGGTGVMVIGSVDMNGNRFTRLDPPETHDVYGLWTERDTVRIRDCFFDADGRAVGYEDVYMDAKNNWWGDSSGPYHPSRNPDGQGGEIMPRVLFEPWIHDTLELEAAEPRALLPRTNRLEPYPNPFNAQTTIKLETDESGIFRLDLFDIGGRLTKTIWSGPVAYQREIKFDAGELPSGIYFARARKIPQGTNIALAKLVLIR